MRTTPAFQESSLEESNLFHDAGTLPATGDRRCGRMLAGTPEGWAGSVRAGIPIYRMFLWSAHGHNITSATLLKWGLRIHEECGHNQAAVALANKLCRRSAPPGSAIPTIRRPDRISLQQAALTFLCGRIGRAARAHADKLRGCHLTPGAARDLASWPEILQFHWSGWSCGCSRRPRTQHVRSARWSTSSKKTGQLPPPT